MEKQSEEYWRKEYKKAKREYLQKKAQLIAMNGGQYNINK